MTKPINPDALLELAECLRLARGHVSNGTRTAKRIDAALRTLVNQGANQ